MIFLHPASCAPESPMSDRCDSRGSPRRIDAEASRRFVAALRSGASREDAAVAAGFSLMGFYTARRHDPAFAAEWTEALASSAAAERRARALAERGERLARGEVRIAPANRRFHQRRRRRNVRFDAERQAVFLTHFAATGDTRVSAAEAGVHESTVHLHRRTDPVFAEAYARALALAYVHLEAEAVRLRLAAQARLHAAVEKGLEIPPPHLRTAEGGEGDLSACPGQGRTACPACGHDPATDAEFDRVMRLLARWDRKPRRPDSRFAPGGRRQEWTFDRAIVELDRILAGMGVRPRLLPSDGAGG